jgi:hypothetical protein
MAVMCRRRRSAFMWAGGCCERAEGETDSRDAVTRRTSAQQAQLLMEGVSLGEVGRLYTMAGK